MQTKDDFTIYNMAMRDKSNIKKEDWDRIIDNLKLGLTITDACAYVKVGRSTFYKYLKLYPDKSLEVEQAKMECKRRMIGVVQRAAIRQWQPAAWWLERKHSEEYALRNKVEVSGVKILVIDDKDEAEKDKEECIKKAKK